MEKRDKISLLDINIEAVKKLSHDIENIEFKTYRFDSLPKDLPIPQAIVDKSYSFDVAISGSAIDGRDYILISANRVDYKKDGGKRIPGKFVTDIHPFIAFIDTANNEVYPSGILWHHADFENRTTEISGTLHVTGSELPVSQLRQRILSDASGSLQENEKISTTMNSIVQVLKRNFDE
ncbi:MAG: hypothetical protein GWP06_04770 [Actinobacteria bacterium]|nr:hypothetical protein [Actinomycetota bacterium]